MAFKHRLFAGIAISLFAGSVYAQPPQFKYSAPATATYPGPIVSNPPTGITSASQALLSTQHFHGVTTNLRGSLLNIATDDADTGSTNAIGLYMPYTYGGPNATGNRIGISVDMFRSAATSISSSAKNYVGIQGQIVSSSGDGGTGFTATTAKGADFGVAGACVELAGATFLLNCTGGEFDSAMETDSSVAIKSIVQLEGQAVDAVQGNNIDTMLLMYDSVGAIGHVNAINIGNGGGSSFGNKFPVSSGGTIFVSSGGSVAKGIDFTGDTFSSSAFASPGFSVDGSGNIIVNGCTGCGGGGGGVTSISATAPLSGGTITTTGSIGLPTSLGGAASYTAHGLLVGEGASALALVGPNATAGAFLLGAGSSADPAYSTAATLSASGFVMSGAAGGGEGAGSINSQSYYQNGSVINIVNFSTGCITTCTYTLPGATDTLAGLGVTQSFTGSDTFTGTLQISASTYNIASGTLLRVGGSGGIWHGYDNAFTHGAYEYIFNNNSGGGAGTALFNIGSNGGFALASGSQDAFSVTGTIGNTGSGGTRAFNCAFTTSTFGSGPADCFSVNTNGTRVAGIDTHGLFQVPGFLVSTLPVSNPTPVKGSMSYVSDAVTCTNLTAPTGGGSTFCPVIYNGSAWLGL